MFTLLEKERNVLCLNDMNVFKIPDPQFMQLKMAVFEEIDAISLDSLTLRVFSQAIQIAKIPAT